MLKHREIQMPLLASSSGMKSIKVNNPYNTCFKRSLTTLIENCCIQHCPKEKGPRI